MTSTEFVISTADEEIAASVQRQGEHIVLELELPSGEVRQRRIPFRRYFTSNES